MPSERYAYEKFMVAVDTLATGSGDIRTRLRDAVVPGLVGLRPEDFGDEDDRTEFGWIMGELRKQHDEREGSVAASLAAMSDEQCVTLAKKIVNLQHSLRRKDDLE